MSDDCTSPCNAGPAFPRTVWNRPGLPRIGYRIGGYAEFRGAMLAGIDRAPLLAAWTHRGSDDPGIALLEGAAVLGDVLTFYQELYANEAYLRTARWRESVGDLVRLVGYRLAPGIGGRALFAFEVKGEAPVAVPAGFALKAELEGEKSPTDFETVAEMTALPALGRFRLYRPRSAAAAIPAGTQALEIVLSSGSAPPPLRAGDRLMLLPPTTMFDEDVARAAQPEAETLTVARVETVLDRAVVHFERPTALAHAATVKAVRIGRAFRHFGAAAPPQVTRMVDVAQQTVTVNGVSSVIPAHQKVQQAATEFQRNLASAFTQITGAYGHLYSRIGVRDVPLESAVSDLSAGARLVCQGELGWAYDTDPKPFTVVRTVERVTSEGRQWGMSSGTTTTVRLAEEIILNSSYAWPYADLRTLRFTEALAEMTLRLPSDGSDADAVGLDFHFWGARGDAAALAGRPLLVIAPDGTVRSASAASAAHPTVLAGDAAEVGLWPVSLAAAPAGLVSRDFDERDPHAWVHGNVVEATQGKREREAALGNGDARQQWQSFKLPKAPLTYLPAPGDSPPIAPELEIRVGGRLWRRVDSFFGLGEHDEVYVVREDLKGESWVQFGDGKTGRRLPSGVRNVVARYRTGTGAHGAVKEGKKVQPGKLERLTKVHLPGVVSGGAGPEEAEGARKAAPGRLQSLDRLVSLADYEAETLAIPGVTKARAAWGLSSGIPSIVLTVLMEGGREGEWEAVADAVRGHDRCRGPNRHPLSVVEGTFLHVSLSAAVAFDPTYRREEVEAAIRAALGAWGGGETESAGGLFSLARRRFGEAEYATRAEAAIQNVAGVRWTRVTALSALGESDDPETLPDSAAGLLAKVGCGGSQVLRLWAGHLHLAAVALPQEVC